jgi:putative ABC transport system substrate-binding protein
MTTRRRGIVIGAAALFAAAIGRPFAQTPGKVYRIGYLVPRDGPSAFDEALLQGLRERGYVVGRNLAIEYRWAGNDASRLRPLAEDLVRSQVDVIVVPTAVAAHAALSATRTIPIVMTSVPDPVGMGLVASLARPGGNVTGLTIASTELARKRLQVVRELVPGATRIALLGLRVPSDAKGTERASSFDLMASEMLAAAQSMDVALVTRVVAHRDELPDAFAQFRMERAQALVVQINPVTFEHRATVIELAARQRLPALYEVRVFVDDGGLVSYGPDVADGFRRAASHVDRILRGAKPGDLAIEGPNKFELVINLKAAQALGLVIPQPLLLRADEAIR